MDSKGLQIGFGETAGIAIGVLEEVTEEGKAGTESATSAAPGPCDENAKEPSGNISSTCSTDDSLSESHSSHDLHQPDDTCQWPMSHCIQRDATPSPRHSDEIQPIPRVLPPYLLPSSPAWYIVSYLGGIEVRTEPRFDAPRTGVVLKQNEVAPISEEVDGGDGRIYLRLVDGGGWIFDDSRLMPQDPSVMRGCWLPHPPCAQAAPTAPCVLSTNAPQAPVSRFRVAYLGGIRVRTAASIESPPTGITLMQGDVFNVNEEVKGADGRLYLKLSDQPGWAFDDSALVPQDPSALRESWEARAFRDTHSALEGAASVHRVLATDPPPQQSTEGWEWNATWTRRGGARRNKRGNATISRHNQSRRS